MSTLASERCEACEGGVKPFDAAKANSLLAELANWQLAEGATKLTKRFAFKGFARTMFFINAVAFIANQEMHHPDVKFGYNFCEITFTTHAINGLSKNDSICAAKVDQLLV